MIRRTRIHQPLETVRAVLETVYPLFGDSNAIMVTARPDAEDAVHDDQGWLAEGRREGDFTVVNPQFRGTAVEELLGKLPFPIGRARILRMPKKSCLSIHWDTSPRYHYAIVTNPACYLIHVDGDVGRFHHLPADGYVYEMDARLTHTAINASRHERIHLVMSDARDEGLTEGRPEAHASLLRSR